MQSKADPEMRSPYARLKARLDGGETILLDGATGTELELRHVPMVQEAWTAAAIRTHPEIVQAVHEEYLRIGADVIITNTFSTSRHLLAGAGLEEHFEALNREAVTVALRARQRLARPQAAIAGSISTTTMFQEQPPPAVARDNFTRQATLLAEAGADFLILEMMRDIEYTRIALTAAQSTGLPVWIGYSCAIDASGDVRMFLPEHSLADCLQAIDPSDADVVSIMHTLTEDVDACLAVVDANWSGPVGVYAHSGDFIMPHWQFNDMISPEAYATHCEDWLARGVQVIGGCCGIGPRHMREIQSRMPHSAAGA